MSIFDNVKDVAKLAQEVGKLDLYQKAVDLMMQVTELAQENMQLKNEIATLKQRLDVRDSLQYRNNAYWRNGAQGQQDGPFCTCCWDAKGLLIRLSKFPGHAPRCPNCQEVAITGG